MPEPMADVTPDPQRSSDAWPFSGSAEKARRIAELEVEIERLGEVEKAARALDALFDEKDEGALLKPGGLDEWKLDGRRQTFDVSMALLSLHDHLNDVTIARGA